MSTNGTVTSTTTISNNQFTDAPGATDTKFGVSLGAGATPVIQNNLFANLSNAINVLGASPQIVGNEFTGVHYDGGGGGFGVKVREGGASGSNPTIAENFFHDAPLPDNNTSAVSVAKVANNINPVGATLRRNRIFDHGSGVVVFDTNAPVTLDGDLVLASSNSIDIGESTAIPGDGDVTATNITAGAIRLVGNAMEDPDLTLDSSIVSFIYDPGATSETHGCVITFSRGNATGSLDNGCDTYLTTADPQFIDDDPPFGDWENNDYRLAAGAADRRRQPRGFGLPRARRQRPRDPRDMRRGGPPRHRRLRVRPWLPARRRRWRGRDRRPGDASEEELQEGPEAQEGQVQEEAEAPQEVVLR